MKISPTTTKAQILKLWNSGLLTDAEKDSALKSLARNAKLAKRVKVDRR